MGRPLSKEHGAAGLWRQKFQGHEISRVLEVALAINPSSLFAKGLFSR